MRRIGYRRFWAYLNGLSSDSAFMQKLRAPYEAQDEAVRENKEAFDKAFQPAGF